MAKPALHKKFVPARVGSPRLRNSQTTKAAILAAARHAFARSSYDQVGVREIAIEARVNVALLNRYYRSKKQLFRESLKDQALFVSTDAGNDRSLAAERLLENILLSRDRKAAVAFQLFIRSATSDEVAEIVRSELHTQFAKPLAEWLGGRGALHRADMIGTLLYGLLMSRLLLNTQGKSELSPSGLIKNVAPVIQTYIDGKNF